MAKVLVPNDKDAADQVKLLADLEDAPPLVPAEEAHLGLVAVDDDEDVSGSIPSCTKNTRHFRNLITYLTDYCVDVAMINILNTILGAGMLALPQAFDALGIVLGCIVVMLFGLASGFGLVLLTRCAALIGRTSSFNSISKITYPRAAILFDSAIAIKCFGVAVSYLVIIGELMPQVMEQAAGPGHWLTERRYWVAAGLLLVSPFAFMRKLNSLRYTSFVALLGVVYIFLLVISLFADPNGRKIPTDQIELFSPKLVFLKRLPVFVFGFTCHQNIFSVYNELRRNTSARINTVTWGSIAISAGVYLTMGTLGYLMYGHQAESNILKNLPKHMPAVTFGRVAIVVLVWLSYPLQCHPCRASVHKVIESAKVLLEERKARLGGYTQFDGEDGEYAQQEESFATPTEYEPTPLNTTGPPVTLKRPITIVDSDVSITPPGSSDPSSIRSPLVSPVAGTDIPTKLFNSITLGIILLSLMIALLVSELGVVLGFVGATGSTTICYILPSIFYLKVTEGKAWTADRMGAAFLLVSGLIIMPVCVGFLFVPDELLH